MAVPTLFSNLSTTPGTNVAYISGSDSPIVLDDHLRTVYAFVASISANTSTNGWASPYAALSGAAFTGAVSGITTLAAASATFTGAVSGITALTTTANTILGDASTDTLNVGNGDLVKDAAGNVGIGTTTAIPGVKVNVAGGINAAGGLNSVGSGGFYNAANKFGIDNNAGQTRFYSSGANSATRGSYDLRITDSTGALDISVLTISNAGNVTINAPISGNALTVSGGLRVDAEVTTVSPTGGAAGTPPAAPVGYVTINIGGTDRKIAFYA